MAGKGPMKTPTRILEMRGSWRAKERQLEPIPGSRDVEMPDYLTGRAREVWDNIVPKLNAMFVLGDGDATELAHYCEMQAEWERLMAYIRDHGSTKTTYDKSGEVKSHTTSPQFNAMIQLSQQLLRLSNAFGMTPAARSSIRVPDRKAGETVDARARFLGKEKK